MATYLGEEIVSDIDTPYFGYTPQHWAMYFIEAYGQIDGAHHKAWVLDQVARVLRGTSVTIKLARWDDGQFEYRITTDEPSESYNQWVIEMKGQWLEEDDCFEYDYDEGIAP